MRREQHVGRLPSAIGRRLHQGDGVLVDAVVEVVDLIVAGAHRASLLLAHVDQRAHGRPQLLAAELLHLRDVGQHRPLRPPSYLAG